MPSDFSSDASVSSTVTVTDDPAICSASVAVNPKPTNAKRLSPAEEEKELRDIRELFWRYVANPECQPDSDADYPVWIDLRKI